MNHRLLGGGLAAAVPAPPRRRRYVQAFALLSLALAGCSTPPARSPADAPAAAPRYERPSITSASPLARRLVEDGLVQAWGFNHDAAIESFREAARLDPTCAMAWWGLAYANGPHMNFPVQLEDRAKVALDALARARTCGLASEVERGLLDALAKRYSDVPAASRAALDEAYATALGQLQVRFPQDIDVAALHAEALMNLHPWDLWTQAGEPKHDVLRIVAILDGAAAASPDHPLVSHLLIHALEASPEPGRALPAADRLRALVPGSSHLLHMPSHIDIRTGRFVEAAAANERAIAVDREQAATTPRAGFYRAYMAHNQHMLAFVSMMEGRREAALAAARGMLADVPPEFVAASGPIIDGLMPVALHVLVRFGRWQEVLDEPPLAPELLASSAVRQYARGVAFTALGQLEEAEQTLAALRAEVEAMDERAIGNNPAKAVLGIPIRVLEGELLAKRGRTDEAVVALRAAVALEDALLYDEPPDWMMPARHPLGAVLLAAGRFAEAEPVLREDQARFPGNIWSLVGLSHCLRARGAPEATELEARVARARARADGEVSTCCACQSPPPPPAGR